MKVTLEKIRVELCGLENFLILTMSKYNRFILWLNIKKHFYWNIEYRFSETNLANCTIIEGLYKQWKFCYNSKCENATNLINVWTFVNFHNNSGRICFYLLRF